MAQETFQIFSETDLKEEMERLAEQNVCQVEVVIPGEIKISPDGTGCLLRYQAPEQ